MNGDTETQTYSNRAMKKNHIQDNKINDTVELNSFLQNLATVHLMKNYIISSDRMMALSNVNVWHPTFRTKFPTAEMTNTANLIDFDCKIAARLHVHIPNCNVYILSQQSRTYYTITSVFIYVCNIVQTKTFNCISIICRDSTNT